MSYYGSFIQTRVLTLAIPQDAGGLLDVQLNCDDPTWTCSSPGWNQATIDVEVSVYDGEYTKTADIM